MGSSSKKELQTIMNNLPFCSDYKNMQIDNLLNGLSFFASSLSSKTLRKKGECILKKRSKEMLQKQKKKKKKKLQEISLIYSLCFI